MIPQDLVNVFDLNTSIQFIRFFITSKCSGSFFTKAYRRDLTGRCALNQQQTAYGLRTLFTQSDIVFTRSTLISVPFQTNL